MTSRHDSGRVVDISTTVKHSNVIVAVKVEKEGRFIGPIINQFFYF